AERGNPTGARGNGRSGGHDTRPHGPGPRSQGDPEPNPYAEAYGPANPSRNPPAGPQLVDGTERDTRPDASPDTIARAERVAVAVEVDSEARPVVSRLRRWRLRVGSCYTAAALSGRP
ncbi:MAG TPA: hypothetical protein VKC59_00200, partial [Candidatus Limnocylindrales bacterium]|nr:hypothetical protein [Candidatus Limnocylindrales bacterium]